MTATTRGATTRAATTGGLIGSWLVGILVGTALIGVTSPLFVRSYLPLQANETRGVWTLPADRIYRWRSEGYADTRIGPLGMPGKRSVASRDRDVIRVALWGDSQAEGVCVADADKLFAQAERLAEGTLEVFPLARSGEDAADWLTQMPRVEAALDIDVHVMLVVDLEDLLTASEAPLDPPSRSDVAAAQASLAARLPAFVIHAARHLLTEADETTPRRLRFAIGPLAEQPLLESPSAAEEPLEQSAVWRRELAAIRAASRLPILILYAPVAPQIVGGQVVVQRHAEEALRRMKTAAEEAGLHVADARAELLRSAAAGRWPHGFHNGQFGTGHLNRVGNAVVASPLVDHVLKRIPRNESPVDENPAETIPVQAARASEEGK